MPSIRPPSEGLAELRRARLEETVERVKRLRRENAWGDGELVRREDVDALLGKVAALVHQSMRARIEAEMPAQLEGQNVVEIRRRLRDVIDQICDSMQTALEGHEWSRPPRLPADPNIEGRLAMKKGKR